MGPDFLAGRWVLAPSDELGRLRYGAHAFHFSASGDVVHSFDAPEGIQRIFMVWRLDGDDLVTEEPALKKQQRNRLQRSPQGGVTLGDGPSATTYVRDNERSPYDRLSSMYVFAATALRHGLAKTVPGGTSRPFLLSGPTLDSRELRFPSLEEAERTAHRAAVASPPPVRHLAWVYEAVVAQGEMKSNAVLALVSERGLPVAKLFAQRYRHQGGALSLLGSVGVLGERATWLPEVL